MSLPYLRLIQPLTETQWDTVGADIWRTPRPRVFTTGLVGSGPAVRTVAFVKTDPSSHGGLPAVPLDQDNLWVYAEDSTGALVEVSNFWASGFGWTDDFGLDPPYRRSRVFDFGSRPPWRSNESAITRFQSGLIESVRTDQAPEDGPWLLEFRVPWSWFGIDPGVFLFVLARFYSTGGLAAVELLDKEAVLNFSAGVRSYLRRRRIMAWRTIGETLTDHLKRVTLDSGSILRWGGFRDGSDTTQQWGLGLIDWDSLRNLSTVYNADPDEDAGRDMFLTEQLVVRTADEFVVNKVKSRWGGGVSQIFRGLVGGQVRYTMSPQFPFQPIGPPPSYNYAGRRAREPPRGRGRPVRGPQGGAPRGAGSPHRARAGVRGRARGRPVDDGPTPGGVLHGPDPLGL